MHSLLDVCIFEVILFILVREHSLSLYIIIVERSGSFVYMFNSVSVINGILLKRPLSMSLMYLSETVPF